MNLEETFEKVKFLQESGLHNRAEALMSQARAYVRRVNSPHNEELLNKAEKEYEASVRQGKS